VKRLVKEAGKPQRFLLIGQQEPENKTKQPGIGKRTAPVTYHNRIRYNPDITNGTDDSLSLFSKRHTVDLGMPNADAKSLVLMPT
jgi:hypothetical protein